MPLRATMHSLGRHASQATPVRRRMLPDDDEAGFGKRGNRLCVDVDEWNLHAAVMVRGDDDVGRENLCSFNALAKLLGVDDALGLRREVRSCSSC